MHRGLPQGGPRFPRGPRDLRADPRYRRLGRLLAEGKADKRQRGRAGRVGDPGRRGLPPPFWSVIVPLYNRTTYLKQCIDSVLDQDPGPQEMEILVIDDASPADLGAFVNDIGRGRIRYIRNPTNLGLYPSTNAAIQTARGRFLHILHDDDWVENGFYTK